MLSLIKKFCEAAGRGVKREIPEIKNGLALWRKIGREKLYLLKMTLVTTRAIFSLFLDRKKDGFKSLEFFPLFDQAAV